jgi:hypothetical protein
LTIGKCLFQMQLLLRSNFCYDAETDTKAKERR